MTIDEAIALVKIERECVIRADICDRKCEKCDLLQDSTELTDMYEQLAEWLEELKEYQEIRKKNPFLVDMIKHDKIVRNKAIDEAMVASAKAICIGCGYLKGTKCTYTGSNCGVSKPMLEAVMKALEQLKAGEAE